nr:Uncharacterised protein [Klebsiella pneumoniae]
MISLIRSLVLLVSTSFSGIFFDFHQVVHKVGEIKLVKINPTEFRGGNAPTVRTAGAAKTDMQLTVSSLLLNDLRQF